MRRIVVFLPLVCLAAPAGAATREQTLDLAPGWNAVWLEVEPRDARGLPEKPDVVFANAPAVRAVARFLPANHRMEFVQDPSAEALASEFWLKWRRNTVVGGNTLGSMPGNTAYLVENASDAPLTVTVSGDVAFHRYEWVPDSYNLFGVPVEGSNGPTFAEYFGPATAHPVGQILKLSAGKWTAVASGERFRRGAAYWVYARGGSSYQGPLPVLLTTRAGVLDFGETAAPVELTAGNLAATASTLSLRRVQDGGLGLFNGVSGQEIIDYALTTDGTGSGALAPQATAALRLEPRRAWTTAPPARENLYRVVTTLGSGSSFYQWLPVRASLPLPQTASSGSALVGLWIGDVTLTQATSLVAGKAAAGTLGGPRLEPVRRPLSFRLILHVDSTGQTRLLEHATLMKRRRASDDLPEEEVIVVDDTKIPQFVGIESRGGKLVGRRFDTAAYDLPRTVIPPTSADTDPLFNPATLPATYHLSLPLTGSLSPGGSVATAAGSFVFDPWHRTNPYRHVFNPEHRQGFRIVRSMTLQFDAAGSPEARQLNDFGITALSGVFEETVSGLMKSGDAHSTRGRFVLRRLSAVDQLQ